MEDLMIIRVCGTFAGCKGIANFRLRMHCFALGWLASKIDGFTGLGVDGFPVIFKPLFP